MKLLGLFLVCLFVSHIDGYVDRKCGQNLDKVLWDICRNGFNSMSTSKRTVHSNQIIPSIVGDSFPYESNLLDNIFQIEKQSLVGKNRRARMLGIVEECCKRPCSYDELAAYCLSFE